MTRSLSEITNDLGKASGELRSAAIERQNANKRETECLNRVNSLQQEFDEAYKAIRKDAPNGTDWTTSRRGV